MRKKFKSGTPTMAAIAVSGFYEPNHPVPSVHDSKWTAVTQAVAQRIVLSKRFERCLDLYLAAINNNHGIKQSNLIALLSPIGFDLSTLKTTDLLACDSFGDMRGKIAHGKPKTVIDPFSEKTTVDNLETFFDSLCKDIIKLV